MWSRSSTTASCLSITAWRGRLRGTARQSGSPGRPARFAVVAKFSHRARIRSDTALPVLQPAQLERRVLAARQPDCPRRRAIRWRARRRGAAAAASGWPSRTGTGRPARRRCGPRRTRSTASGSRGRAPRPCPGLAAAAVGGADLVLRRQLQAGLLGGDLGEHRLDGLGRDRHQRRLHPPEQRGLVLVGADDQRHRMRPALAGQLDRIVGHEVAVDDRRERQRAGAAHRHIVEQRLATPRRSRRSAPRSAGRRRRCRTPSASRNCSATRRARARRRPTWPASSARSRRENSPAAAGLASSVVTMPAPADSPNSVTRPGSPPNAAMLSRTQCSADSTSRSPRLVSNRRRRRAERRTGRGIRRRRAGS